MAEPPISHVLRSFLGLTPQEFALLVGVDTRTVMRWESGGAEPAGASHALIHTMYFRIRLPGGEKLKELLVDSAKVGGLPALLTTLFFHWSQPQ